MAAKLKMKICRGKKAKLFVDNIFDAEWTPTGKVEVMKDPIHNVKKDFTWYTVQAGEEVKSFAFAEVAPDQYLFFYE